MGTKWPQGVRGKKVIPDWVNGKKMISDGVNGKKVIPGGVHGKNMIPDGRLLPMIAVNGITWSLIFYFTLPIIRLFDHSTQNSTTNSTKVEACRGWHNWQLGSLGRKWFWWSLWEESDPWWSPWEESDPVESMGRKRFPVESKGSCSSHDPRFKYLFNSLGHHLLQVYSQSV